MLVLWKPIPPLACREALALAHDLNLQRVIVAIDCILVVNDLARSYAGVYITLIHEIKEQAVTLPAVSFRENRASNSEAHRLTRLATSFNFGSQFWLLQPPDGLCIPKYIIDQ
jgi:hypothetical protein